jgi:hypothetical protein
MMLSLNEVESTVWKAARGAGLAWGLAEEAGQAARWMAAQRLDWAAPVVACLAAAEAAQGRLAPPAAAEDRWQPPAGAAALSPLICGPLISDLAFQLAEAGASLRFGPMAHPILLLPFVARVAQDLDIALALSWAGTECLCRGGDVRCTALVDPELVRGVTVARLAPHSGALDSGPLHSGALGEPIAAIDSARGTIHVELLDRLEKWVRLTYVSASAESRLAGAGAGLTDND